MLRLTEKIKQDGLPPLLLNRDRRSDRGLMAPHRVWRDQYDTKERSVNQGYAFTKIKQDLDSQGKLERKKCDVLLIKQNV